MSKSDTAENATLDAWFGSTTLGPATWLVAAYTAAPTDAGGGTEATGGGYARVSVTNNAPNFPAASGGSKTTGAAITFPVSTGAWSSSAPIVAIGFHTAAGDNLRFHMAIAPGDQQAITAANQQLSFPAGSITITES